MAGPLTVDVPHRLGREGAKARIDARIGDLGRYLPGGMGEVTSHWIGPYAMALTLAAMGQRIAARLDVEETLVRVHLDLPPMLAMFGGMIGSALREGGAKLLEDKRG